jgi:hypothetical protein
MIYKTAKSKILAAREGDEKNEEDGKQMHVPA